MADGQHQEQLGTCFALIEASLLLRQGIEGMLRANLSDMEVQQFIRSLELVRDSMRPADRAPADHDTSTGKD